MAPNKWHHLRVVYKLVSGSPTTTIYIDSSVPIVNNVPTPTVYTYNEDWTLTLGNFNGDIDEVRISNIDRGSDLSQ